MCVLVVVEHSVCVVTRVPVLSKGHGGHSGVNVLLGELAGVPAHEVKAPAVEANAVSQPLHPVNDVITNVLLENKARVKHVA